MGNNPVITSKAAVGEVRIAPFIARHANLWTRQHRPYNPQFNSWPVSLPARFQGVLAIFWLTFGQYFQLIDHSSFREIVAGDNTMDISFCCHCGDISPAELAFRLVSYHGRRDRWGDRSPVRHDVPHRGLLSAVRPLCWRCFQVIGLYIISIIVIVFILTRGCLFLIYEFPLRVFVHLLRPGSL